MKKISFIIPAFNEEGNIEQLYKQVKNNIKNFQNYEFEFLFIENGSTDKTLEKIKKIKKLDKSIKYIKLSRNFRMDGGIASGIDNVDCDAAIIMTANLQDDPRVIPKFIELWEQGYDHVYGIVKSRPGKSLIRKINSRLFYKLINRMSNNLVPVGVSDYRLVNRKVIESVKLLTESNRFYRGFFAWVGFKSTGIKFDRQKRFSGKSHANTSSVLSFAIKGILAFSTKPLKISIFLTLVTSSISLIILIQQTIQWLKYGVPFDGYGTLTGIMLLFISLIFLLLSLFGEYIGLIYDETKKRPHYIIDKKF